MSGSWPTMMNDDVGENRDTFVIIGNHRPPKCIKTLGTMTVTIVFAIHMVVVELGLNVDSKSMSETALVGFYLQKITILGHELEESVFDFIFHFIIAPIFMRCPSTRAASVATSPVICGSGVA